ncbi:hypothetical protein BGZ58_006365 [Dissophora ornata]|nr:hypothetical protein BGZ58_006365 [Dissophora ornata]
MSSHSNEALNAAVSDGANAAIEVATKDVESNEGKITHSPNAALLGFSAEVPDAIVQALLANPDVAYIEINGKVTAYTQELLK